MKHELTTTKFYIRHRAGYPETDALDCARRGFNLLGIDTDIYEFTEDIPHIPDLGPTVGVAGYIEDIHWALTQLRKPLPRIKDYPEILAGFLGRNIRQMKLGDIRSSSNSYFIKPMNLKEFSGMIWNNDDFAKKTISNQPDTLEVWVSELVKFKSEYRAFILDGQVLDCKHYKGDWSVAPDKRIIEAGAEMLSSNGPKAYCLDWGVTNDGRTLLVEFNDGFSFNTYGLNPVMCAYILSSRWTELFK